MIFIILAPPTAHSSKRSEFLGFYCYLCHVMSEFCLFLISNTKIGEISDMTKS